MAGKTNGKQKGNNFERKIATALSERFHEYTGLEKSFRRSQDSGSFFGRTNEKRLETYNLEKATFGDIITPSDFKFELECKHYKTPPTLSVIFKQNCKQWDTWIAQAMQDSKNAGKKMAVIIKYNNVDEIVILENSVDGVVNIPYKEFFIISFEDFLKQPNDVFFETKKED